MRSRQQYFSEDFKPQKEFGGALLKKSHAKTARPISLKHAMHVTLKSSRAKGSFSLLASRGRYLLIEKKTHQLAKKCRIQIYRFANAGNHLHLLVRVRSRLDYLKFIRSLSGIVVRIALGVERGRAIKSALKNSASNDESVGFWDQRPWSRVVVWRSDFFNVRKYVENHFKFALGFLTDFELQKFAKTSTA